MLVVVEELDERRAGAKLDGGEVATRHKIRKPPRRAALKNRLQISVLFGCGDRI
jgi:hypothetical protein